MSYEIVVNGELYHHGILGQKWGIRRFQNKDGTLTSAGKQRYNVDIETAKKNLKDAQYVYDTHSPNVKNKRRLDLAKRKLEDEKVKEKLNKETKKSKNRLILEAEYKSKGMNDEEAEIAAYKHERTKKILATVGVMAVASAAAYVAYKHYDKVTDKIISSDTVLHNISVDSNKGVENAFYASYHNSDRSKYKGLYAKQLGYTYGHKKDIYDTAYKYKKDLKVASRESGKKVLEDIFKNDTEFRDILKDRMHTDKIYGGMTPKQTSLYDKAYNDIKKGKITDHVYNAFNLGLDEHDEDRETLNKKFYNALEKSGYGAVQDVNDRLYSGYNSKNPIIVFGNKSAVDTIKQTKVDNKEIDKHFNNFYTKQYAKIGATSIGGGILFGKGLNAIDRAQTKKQEDEYVQKYRKKHPNTKLSYNEILEERAK